jgi:hypothetical protein
MQVRQNSQKLQRCIATAVTLQPAPRLHAYCLASASCGKSAFRQLGLERSRDAGVFAALLFRGARSHTAMQPRAWIIAAELTLAESRNRT